MLLGLLGTGVGTRNDRKKKKRNRKGGKTNKGPGKKEGGAKGKVSLEPMENEITVLAKDDNYNLKFEIRIVVGIVLV